MQAATGSGNGGISGEVLPRGACEVPLAPGERFMDRYEMRSNHLSNQLRLAQPLLIGSALMVNHCRKRIHLLRKTTRQRILRDPVNKPEKRSQPGFHKYNASGRLMCERKRLTRPSVTCSRA